MQILFQDPFGRAVAEMLERDGGPVAQPAETAIAAMEACDGPTGPVILIAGLFRPGLFDRMDLLAHQARQPWAPIFPSHQHLFCGPVVVPGQGACLDCFRRRHLSNLRPREFAEHEEILGRHADAHADFAIPGFLPSTVAAAVSFIEALETGMVARAGTLLRLSLTSPDLERSHIIPIHGCRRCGSPASTGARFTAHLIPALGSPT